MYLLYVDESGDTGQRGSNHLILTGAAIFEGKWRWIRSDIEGLITKYFPSAADRPRELHAADIRKGRHAYSKLSAAQRTQLLADACKVLTGLKEKELSVFSIVVDKAWWFARNPGKTGNDLYLASFEDMVSRFDYYLKRRHRQGESAKGLIIADPRHEAFSRALRAAVLQFHRVGTQWARLENIIESVLFLESHESPGIQLADLASYAFWRAAECSDTSLAKEIKYCVDREGFLRSFGSGKWHGLRYHGPAGSTARVILGSIWS